MGIVIIERRAAGKRNKVSRELIPTTASERAEARRKEQATRAAAMATMAISMTTDKPVEAEVEATTAAVFADMVWMQPVKVPPARMIHPTQRATR